MKRELDVLVEQLDELLGEPIIEPDDALEVAIVAGLAQRLGAPDSVLADAVAWRDGLGSDLLEAMWAQVDLTQMVEEVDACTSGDRTEEQVEETLFDVDDVIAAAVWCDRLEVVRAEAKELSTIIRGVPDVFASIGSIAVQMARSRSVAEHLGLYDYWFALADAAKLTSTE